MRNIQETLSALGQVTPDTGYSSRSKRLILANQREKRIALPLSIAQVLKGSAVMAGSVLALVGGITVARLLVSEQPTLVGSSVNVQTLEAEANAVDAQLGLAQAQHSAVKAAETKSASTQGIREAKSEITELAIAAAGAEGDTSSVDEALLALIE